MLTANSADTMFRKLRVKVLGSPTGDNGLVTCLIWHIARSGLLRANLPSMIEDCAKFLGTPPAFQFHPLEFQESHKFSRASYLLPGSFDTLLSNVPYLACTRASWGVYSLEAHATATLYIASNTLGANTGYRMSQHASTILSTHSSIARPKSARKGFICLQSRFAASMSSSQGLAVR
jgi:hypothetical protein